MLETTLQNIIEEKFHPVAIQVNKNKEIIEWVGDWVFYGIFLKEQHIGADLSLVSNIFIHLPLDEITSLPFITLENGITVSISITAITNGYILSFLQAEEDLRSIQEAQQSKNENILLYQRLKKLTNALEITNQELQMATDAQNQFLSGVSHEFRTPITSILGHLDLLKNRYSNIDSEDEKLYTTIKRNAKYLLVLIDNLLEQGKIAADKVKLSYNTIKLDEFFRFITETLTLEAAAKGLTMQYKSNFDSTLNIKTDEHYLYLIIVNLISNAIKFTDNGGVSLYANWSNDQLTIDVVDTGIGISESDLKKIQLPFARGENSNSYKGAGLGLSIVTEVAKALAGSLSITSTLHKGTRVTLKLPAVNEKESNHPVTNKANKHLTVFIVEDDPDIVILYRSLLKKSGITAEFYNFDEAVEEQVKQHNPDLIILDYHLGKINGLDIAQRIRAHGYKMPMVLMTATTSINNHLVDDASAAGCNKILNKPRDMENLAETVFKEVYRSQSWMTNSENII